MSVNKAYLIQEFNRISVISSTPSVGTEILYPKTDGKWYHMGTDGVEKLLSQSYRLGTGFTYSSLTQSFDYQLSIAFDGSSITYSNNQLRVGVLTASNLSNNYATAGYILSANNDGTLTWLLNGNNTGAYGSQNFIPKYTGISSLTNSNIYDSGTSVNIFTASNSVVPNVKFFVNGYADVAGLYIASSPFTYITSNLNKMTLNTTGFNVTDGAYTYVNSDKSVSNGYTFNILNSLIQITSTGSNNATSSILIPNINVIGIGTTSATHLLHINSIQPAFRLVDSTQGDGKLLISDTNGVSKWYMPTGVGIDITGYTFSLKLNSNSGLTNSSSGLNILLNNNSGLTTSNNGLNVLLNNNSGLTTSNNGLNILLNNNSGLTTSNSELNILLNSNSGLTTSNNGLNIQLANNSGLTISSLGLDINPNFVGNGLTYSNGVISSTIIYPGIKNTVPYYGTTNSLTSSIISQVSNSILVGTTSNSDGYKMIIFGSVSITSDSLIANTRFGRGRTTTSLVIGGNTINDFSSGGSVVLGDNALIRAGGSVNSIYNISIGINTMTAIQVSLYNTAVGANAMQQSLGTESTAIGFAAGWTGGSRSVFVGATTNGGDRTISIGYGAGNQYSGNNNIFLGYLSGYTYTGSSSVFIGGYTLATSSSNNIYISDGQGNLRMYIPSSGHLLLGTMSDNGSLLQVSGSMSIISATANAFRLSDSTQGSNKILKSDLNGYGSWSTYKYSGTQSFSAGSPVVVTHNLNSMFYIIQLFDYTTGDEIFGGYSSRGLTQATITLSTNVSNCGIVIMG